MPLSELPRSAWDGIRFVLTGVDDRLTSDGRLTVAGRGALERLRGAGYRVMPVTGGAGFAEFAGMLLS